MTKWRSSNKSNTAHTDIYGNLHVVITSVGMKTVSAIYLTLNPAKKKKLRRVDSRTQLSTKEK